MISAQVGTTGQNPAFFLKHRNHIAFCDVSTFSTITSPSRTEIRIFEKYNGFREYNSDKTSKMGNILAAASFVYLCTSPDNVNALSQKLTPTRIDTINTRNAFLRQLPIGLGAIVQVWTLGEDKSKGTAENPISHTRDCACPSCTVKGSTIDDRITFSKVAFAYERRDVGGESPSSDMAAMNRQAFETMNRLEKDGVKLETAEEQKASLTAALSDYSYQPSTGKKDQDKSKTKSRNSSDKQR